MLFFEGDLIVLLDHEAVVWPIGLWCGFKRGGLCGDVLSYGLLVCVKELRL